MPNPDLISLEYWFWGKMDDMIARRKPKTLNDLTRMVDSAEVRRAYAAASLFVKEKYGPSEDER